MLTGVRSIKRTELLLRKEGGAIVVSAIDSYDACIVFVSEGKEALEDFFLFLRECR